MKMTAEGLHLIRRFEGLRTRAYRCPSGIWTIGYGHTSMAGPPDVKAGLEIGGAEADAILASDVTAFAEGVSSALKVPVSDRQFSALVSFAYNVGLGNFRASSVLKAINAGDMAAVPRRLQLWNKAGGKVLAGLARRRAAEAELFLSDQTEVAAPDSPRDVDAARGKPLQRSTTVLAAILSALAGAFPIIAQSLGVALRWPLASFLLVVIALAAAWILRERFLKSIEEGL